MSALNEPVAKRIAKLFRLLGSDFDGEVLAAARKMKQQLGSEGLNFNDIATVIENHQGEIEEKKYSDADAEVIFAKGVEKGRTEEARKQQAPPEFYNADGKPRWYEIALYCEQNSSQLRDEWERDFVSGMPEKMIRWKNPTPKQIPILLSIFKRLGGYYDAKAAHIYR
jgi:hypothetical protein